jgi:hypothetical protein
MWDCDNCGCQAIADSVEFCPVVTCHAPRPDRNAVAESEGAGSASGSAAEDLALSDPQPSADPAPSDPPAGAGSASTKKGKSENA